MAVLKRSRPVIMLRYWWIAAVVILAGCLLLALFAHGYVGSFSRFMADNYCFASRVQANGILKAQQIWYNSWTGRFSFNFAESLGGWLGAHAVSYLPPFSLALWLVVLIGTLSRFRLANGPLADWGAAILLGTLILFTTLDSIPIIAQSFYWVDGMHNYVVPLIWMTFYVGLLSYHKDRQWTSKGMIVWLALSAAITFVAGGFSEMYGALQIGALSMALVLGWLIGSPLFRRTTLPLIASGLLGSLVAIAIVVVAPGNKVRQEFFPPPPDLLSLVRLALSLAGRFIQYVVARSPVNVLAAFVFPAILRAGFISGDVAGLRSRRAMVGALLGIPVATFVLLVCCAAVSAYGISGIPPLRSFVIPQYIVICALVAWGYTLGYIIQQTDLVEAFRRESWLWQAGLGAMVVILGGSALQATQRTLAQAPLFSAYAAAWDEVDSLVLAAKAQGVTRVSVPLLKNPASLEEPGADSTNWVNQCVSDYYGVTVLAHSPAPAPTAADLSSMTSLDADIGGIAQVVGYKVDRSNLRPGGTLSVTVYWRPRMATEQPYTVFVHLFDNHAGILAQADTYPGQGQYPTTLWVYDRLFADIYRLDLPDHGPAPDEAQIILGLYDTQTLRRLPVSGQDTDAGQSWVRLGTVQLHQKSEAAESNH
jgi:hypothetical protein